MLRQISIIIPVINEEKIIKSLLDFLAHYPSLEIIFVDGGSHDRTVEIIKQYNFTVLSSAVRRRSSQMNLGAQYASGKILLFLHSDTLLPPNFVEVIRETSTQKDFVLGAFSLQIDNPQPVFRWLERLVNWRSQYLSLPYGDQGLFIDKSLFSQINGFQDLEIMEDFNLVQRLQKRGKIYIIKEAVTTSARRWQKLGIFKTTVINQLVILGYNLNINNQRLASLYRQMKK